MEKLKTVKKNIVVIGGGFAGLNFIQKMYNSKHYNITLIDKNNYNYFTPLLYQVATSFLEPASISYPYRKLFRGKGIAFRMANLERIEAGKNTIYLQDGSEMSYDILVLAAGTSINYFENENIRQTAFVLKDIDDALYMRNELIKILEKASVETDPAEKKKMLSIVIAGGGPTGVEIAGMLAEFKNYIMTKDYPEMEKDSAEIYILDGSSSLLAMMSDKTHQLALNRLQALGVHVHLKTQVTKFEDQRVFFSDGKIIEASTLIWAAGVKAVSVNGISEKSLQKTNRIITDHFNRVNSYENVYAIGDISIQYGDPNYPSGHPQLAQPSIQQGKRLARNLTRKAENKPMRPFKYFDRGEMAIIGRNFAVADLFKHRLHVGGLLGLLSWLFIHVVSLVNYNNKVKTLYSWIIAYLTRDQFLRMIFRTEKMATYTHKIQKVEINKRNEKTDVNIPVILM